MSLWDRVKEVAKNELIDIVEWLDDTNNTLVWRFERHENELKNGAQLIVREGQLAILVNQGQAGKGQAADVFGPGMHTLSTANLPILSTLQGWKYGFDSPFKAEVYFFSTKIFPNLRWGTPGPCTMRDPEFGAVRVTAFGIYGIRIDDPKLVLTELVSTNSRYTLEQIEENLRGKIGQRIKEVMPELGIPVLDLESKVTMMGDMLRERIAEGFAKFGLELTEVQVQDVGLPEEVEKAIDAGGAMRAIGNMHQFGQYQAAQAMRDAANNEGAAGNMMGMGVGLMMNQGMGQLFSQPGGAQPQPGIGGTPPGMAPPPLPAAVAYFVAVNGQQAGPFDLNALQAQVASGQITRDSLVWKQGMPAWGAAGLQADLGGLFAAAPPPLPPQ